MLRLLLFIPLILIFSCLDQGESNSFETETSIVHKKQFLKKSLYQVEYYENWKIDSTTGNHDADSYITLYSPSEEGYVSILIFNKSINVKNHIEEQVKAHLNEVMKNGKVTYFTNWGSYSGYGAMIEGKVSGIFKGLVKIFSYTNGEYSFLFASQLIYTAKEQDEPGLKLIESSFRFTE